ncbi:MAG TPA: hypothetical protein VGQ95_08800 [Chthoniobacterales bacterium]|nr:hypothetical protein [Chthoniobacterales bacterium]
MKNTPHLIIINAKHSAYRVSIGILFCCAALSNSQAAIDRLRVVIENDLRYPGEARIWCPHLRDWIETKDGVASLPSPFGGWELIVVEPKDPTVYGPRFRRSFPADGLISLHAILVTVSIRQKAEQLRTANPAEAATGFAIAATRTSSVDPKKATEDQRKALESLGVEYRAPTPYVKEGEAVRASPQLVSAITAKLGKGAVPSDGNFTLKDVTKASRVKTYNRIIDEPQRQHFESLKR